MKTNKEVWDHISSLNSAMKIAFERIETLENKFSNVRIKVTEGTEARESHESADNNSLSNSELSNNMFLAQEKTIQNLKGSLHAQSECVRRQAKENNNIKEEINKLHERITILKEENKERHAIEKHLQNKISDQMYRIKDLEEDVSATVKQNTFLEENLKFKSHELERLQNIVREQDNSINEKTHKNNVQHNRIVTLSEQAENSKQLIESYKHDLKEQEEENNVLVKERDAAEDKTREIEKEYREMKLALETSTKEKMHLQAKWDALDKENDMLRGSLEKKNKTISDGAKQVDFLQEANGELISALEEAKEILNKNV